MENKELHIKYTNFKVVHQNLSDLLSECYEDKDAAGILLDYKSNLAQIVLLYQGMRNYFQMLLEKLSVLKNYEAVLSKIQDFAFKIEELVKVQFANVVKIQQLIVTLDESARKKVRSFHIVINTYSLQRYLT